MVVRWGWELQGHPQLGGFPSPLSPGRLLGRSGTQQDRSVSAASPMPTTGMPKVGLGSRGDGGDWLERIPPVEQCLCLFPSSPAPALRHHQQDVLRQHPRESLPWVGSMFLPGDQSCGCPARFAGCLGQFEACFAHKQWLFGPDPASWELVPRAPGWALHGWVSFVQGRGKWLEGENVVWDGRELSVGLSRSRETGHFQDCSAVMLEWFPCQK